MSGISNIPQRGKIFGIYEGAMILRAVQVESHGMEDKVVRFP